MPTNKKRPTEDGKTPPSPSSTSPANPSTSDTTADTSTSGTAEASTAASVTAAPKPPADAASETPGETTQSKTAVRITAIEIENFKGIGRPIQIDLRPITLLFGRNSAGKSTVLHALCYANDILNHHNIDAETTVSGGDNVRLGGFNNLVHSHDPAKQVRFRFDLALDNWDVPDPLPSRLISEFEDFLDEYNVTDFFQEPVVSAWVEVAISASQGKPTVTSYEVGVNDLYIGRLYLNDVSKVMLEVNDQHPLLYSRSVSKVGELDPSIETKLLETIKSLEPTEKHELRRQLLQDERQAYGDRTRAFAETAGLIGQRNATTGTDTERPAWQCTTIPTFYLHSAVPPWDELLRLDLRDLEGYEGLLAAPEFSEECFSPKESLRAVMSYVLVGIGSTLSHELSSFRYIGPVRNLQPDTSVGPRTDRSPLWADGSAAWDFLCDRTAAGNSSFLNEVNDWLVREDRLDTGYRLEDHSYVELSTSTPLVDASRILRRLDVSFADGFCLENVDPWIREQFRSFDDSIQASELLPALVDAVKNDDPIDVTITPRRDEIHSAVRQHAASSYHLNDLASDRFADVITEAILLTAVRTHDQYRQILALHDILSGQMRSELQDLLSGIAIPAVHTRLRLATTAQSLPLSTSDIGVGISQVLPVVVAALDPTRPSLTAIEQPELHVHPRLQVALGDLFVPRLDRPGIFLLETHSEHLMLRLLRRIQETTEEELPANTAPLKPDDLSVVFIEQHDGDTRTTRIPVDETGEFTVRWPQGFFEERHDELF